MRNRKPNQFPAKTPTNKNTHWWVRATNERSGQSLIEVLIAIVVGTIMVMAAVSVIAPALKSNGTVTRTQIATGLGREMIDNVKILTSANWHTIGDLATSSSNKYYFVATASPFTVATGTESIISDTPTRGLVGYWKFDEMSGSEAKDYSGNGKDGTLENGPSWTENCKVFSCLTFDDTNQKYVSADAVVSNTNLTLSAWVYPTSYPSERSTIILGNGAYYLSLASDGSLQSYWYGTNPAGYHSSGAGTVPLSSWTHVASVWDGSNVRLYINGNLKTTIGVTGTGNSATGLNIGAENTSRQFIGKIDDVRIYNQALLEEELVKLVNTILYTRYFYVEDASRDSNGNITASSGTLDPSTKKITVVTTWTGGPENQISTYVTRSKNYSLVQSDWSGGAEEEGPVSNLGVRFSTSTNINFSSTTGSMVIPLE